MFSTTLEDKLRLAMMQQRVKELNIRNPDKKPRKQYVDKAGNTYKSKAAFARAHNISVCTVTNHLKKYGHLLQIGEAKPGLVGSTVEIRGVTYASFKEAAAKLGVNREVVYQARKRGKLDNVGVGKGNGKAKKDKK